MGAGAHEAGALLLCAMPGVSTVWETRVVSSWGLRAAGRREVVNSRKGTGTHIKGIYDLAGPTGGQVRGAALDSLIFVF